MIDYSTGGLDHLVKMTPDSLVVKSERRTSSLSPPMIQQPPPTTLTDSAASMRPRLASLHTDRKPLLKFSVSAILAKKGEGEDEDDCAPFKEESRIKEEDDIGSNDAKPFNEAKPFVYGKQKSCHSYLCVGGRSSRRLPKLSISN